MKFNVGDRVRCLQSYDGNRFISGKVGIIQKINYRNYYYVLFDDNINGHSQGNRCWNMPGTRYLELLEAAESIVGLSKEERVLVKCKKLWNQSNWIKQHPKQAY